MRGQGSTVVNRGSSEADFTAPHIRLTSDSAIDMEDELLNRRARHVSMSLVRRDMSSQTGTATENSGLSARTSDHDQEYCDMFGLLYVFLRRP